MEFFKPIIRATEKPDSQTASYADGIDVTVGRLATVGASRARHNLVGEPTLGDKLQALTNDEIRAAYRIVKGSDATLSDRQIRRYRHDQRIPDSRVADLVARAFLIKDLGGTAAAANALGRSESTIRRWRRGTINDFRPDAAAKLSAASIAKIIVASGGSPNVTPKVKFTANVVAKSAAKGDYDQRTQKLFTFGVKGMDREPMPPDRIVDLARALLANDYPAVVAILMEHASLRYAQFSQFNNDNGLDASTIQGLRIEFQTQIL